MARACELLGEGDPGLLRRGGDAAARDAKFCTDNTITDSGELDRELEQVRRRGVAFDHQEAIRGIVGVAAPIFGPGGGVLGAVSSSGVAGPGSTSPVSTPRSVPPRCRSPETWPAPSPSSARCCSATDGARPVQPRSAKAIRLAGIVMNGT
nr:IclR family transcriptional regulator C-terminal domain-containing protein [Nocardia sienata]